VSTNRVEGSVVMEGSVVVSVAGERRYVMEGILSCVTDRQTQEDTHMSDVRGRRASIRLINGQSKTKLSDRRSRSPALQDGIDTR
jgi:hypothetical protein